MKRSVWREVKARRVVVNDPEAFYKFASRQCSDITLVYLLAYEIRSKEEFLLSRWEHVVTIMTIQKQHIFKRAGTSELFVGRHALGDVTWVSVIRALSDKAKAAYNEQPDTIHPPEVPCKDDDSVLLHLGNIQVGDWVLVKYDEKVFPGEVKVIEQREVKVSVTIPSGTCYKWPKIEDAVFFKLANIICKLSPPQFKSARGTFEFAEKW